MEEAEERAFVHTTENTGQVIPKELQNKIYSLMEESHPILKDVNVLQTGTVISIVKHVSINAGDAKNVKEGKLTKTKKTLLLMWHSLEKISLNM